MGMLKKHVPTLTDENAGINTKVLLASLELWTDEDTERNGLGYTSDRDWEESIDALLSLGIVKKRLKPGDCFTGRFILEKP
jgi:nuclear transport factor 2 (NTF2) superfamily protein